MQRVLLYIIIIAVVYAVVLGYANGRLKITQVQFYSGDARVYAMHAHSLLYEGFLHEELAPYRKPPVYPVFLAVAFGLFGERSSSAWIFQVLLYIATIVLFYKISERLFTHGYAYIPVLMLVLFWGGAFYVFKIGSEMLAIFLLTSIVFLTYRYQDKKSTTTVYIWSVFLAVLVLTKPIVLYAVPILLYLLLYSKNYRTNCNIFKHAGIAITIITFIVGGWMVRNYLSLNDYQLEPAGDVIWTKGVLAESSGRDIFGYGIAAFMGDYIADIAIHGYASNPLPTKILREAKMLMRQKKQEGLNNTQINNFLAREGFIKIKHHPIGFLISSVPSIIELNGPITFKGLPITHFLVGTDERIKNSAFVKFIYKMTGTQILFPAWFKVATILVIRIIWYLFLFLVGYGAFLAWKSKKDEWKLILFLVLYFTLMHALIKVPAEVRFIVPVRSFYFLCATLAVLHSVNESWRKRICLNG